MGFSVFLCFVFKIFIVKKGVKCQLRFTDLYFFKFLKFHFLYFRDWHPLEQYSNGSEARFIFQKRKSFNFKMQLKEDGILYISGSLDKVEQAKSDIDEFLEKTRQKYSNNSTTKKVVMKFDYSKGQSTFLKEIKDEELYLELFNEINIEIKDREVFVSGDEAKQKNFTVFLRNKVIAKDRFCESKDPQKSFILGLNSNDEIKLERSRRLPRYSSTESSPPIQPFTSMYQAIPGLKPQLITALRTLSSEMESAYGELSLKFHFGQAFYNLKPRNYSVDEIERSQNAIKYQRLNKGVINSVLPVEKWHFIEYFFSYYFRIYTPEPYTDIRYKVFLVVDDNASTIFKSIRDAKQVMEILEEGPGFLSWPEAGVNRFDIVDPRKDLDLRLRIKMFKSNHKFEKDIAPHLEYLQTNFFRKLEIVPDSFKLKIPELSNGYILSYCRKSIRETYSVPSTSLEVKVSTETILVNHDNYDPSKEVFDVFVEDINVKKALDGNEWSPVYIADRYENVFNFGKKILDRLQYVL